MECRIQGEPPKYAIDYCYQRAGRTLSFVEIRSRKRTFSQYPTMFMGLKKAVEGVSISELTTLPFIFLVEFTDGLYWAKIERQHLSVVSYRDDINWRNDPQDKEPIVLIPMENFRLLRQLPCDQGLDSQDHLQNCFVN